MATESHRNTRKQKPLDDSNPLLPGGKLKLSEPDKVASLYLTRHSLLPHGQEKDSCIYFPIISV
jgi:hypothetical protein